MGRTSRTFLAFGAELLLASSALAAQEPGRLFQDAAALAAPAMGGRGTGTQGQGRAAAFIARRFKALGLQAFPGLGGETRFHFPYVLDRVSLDPKSTRTRWNQVELHMGSEVQGNLFQAKSGDVILAPLGDPAVNGRWVLVPRAPGSPDSQEEEYRRARQAGALGLVYVGDLPTEPEAPESPEEEDPAPSGGVLVMEGAPAPRGRAILALTRKALERLDLGPALHGDAAPRILGTLDYEPALHRRKVTASNVLAYIPGRDTRLRDQFVVVSAHHDHVGSPGGVLHPGADDNASGTAGRLETARLMARAHPRRSVLFLSVSGEEIGLFGSQAFLKRPPVPPSRMVADINLDMIGRGDPGQVAVTPARVEGAVTTLTAEARRLAALEGMGLRDDADPYWTRSDHYNFFKAKIPSIFFFAGMHEDYHRPSDTADKLNPVKMARIVRLAFRLALATADAEGTPTPVPKERWSAWTWPSPVPQAR